MLSEGPPFEVVVCDLAMPVVTGMDLYREIAARVPQQAGRFIFMTGGAWSIAATQFLSAHPGRWIEKPFKLTELRQRIAVLLGDVPGTTRSSTG